LIFILVKWPGTNFIYFGSINGNRVVIDNSLETGIVGNEQEIQKFSGKKPSGISYSVNSCGDDLVVTGILHPQSTL